MRHQMQATAPTVPLPRHAAYDLPRPASLVDELPAYSANPQYESVPHPEDLTRRVIRKHEKKVKKDLKEAEKAEIQCARIKKILPQIYAQLSAACDAPRVIRQQSGPAAFRQQPDEPGVEIVFKSRGIDQKALRQYLPLLLDNYHRELQAADAASLNTQSHDILRPTEEVSPSNPEPLMETTDNFNDLSPLGSASRPPLLHALTTTGTRTFNSDKMTVTAGYFEDYTQKIYFSKKFIELWKKKESGKRENIASGIAMVLVGLKLGLPMFDFFTFAVLDVPRLALQSATGKQTLKLKDR